MRYIYMDESWDLTFYSKLWSKFFVITFLITDNEKDMKIVMKNLHKWMLWKWLKMKGTFFHSTKEDHTTVKRVLDLVSRRNIRITSMILDKNIAPHEITTNQHLLYNQIVWSLLAQCEKRWYLQNSEKIVFIASRRETNKNLNQDFIEIIDNSHSDLIKVESLIQSPKETNWLEIVDAISRAIYKKYEEKNLELYSIIKNKIVLEKLYEEDFFN